jgi:hypothetical protein
LYFGKQIIRIRRPGTAHHGHADSDYLTAQRLSARDDLADYPTPERQDADDENEASHDRYRFAQGIECADTRDARQCGADIAETIFERNDHERADQRSE